VKEQQYRRACRYFAEYACMKKSMFEGNSTAEVGAKATAAGASLRAAGVWVVQGCCMGACASLWGQL
jgi:hypothetical protein